MTRPFAILVPVAAAAVLVTALTGCTPGGTPPTPSGYATTPSAIVTGRAADTAVPQPVLDLDCARLFSLPAFAAAYGAADVLHPVDVLGSEGFNTNLIPDADVLQTLGGISCDWSAGPPTSVDGDMAAPVEVTLAVLPNAAAQWAHFDASYGAANEGVHCYAPGPLNCWSDQLVGTNWVEIYMYGVGGEPEANALATAINTAVSSAGPGAAAWTPPHGTKTFGDCTQLLTPAQVATDLGVTATTIAFTTGEGGWSLREGAQANANAVGCLFQYADSDNTVGQVTWLRGGAWAHDAAIAASNPGWGSPAPAAIAGLAADDSATIRCNAPDPAAEEYTPVCTVDLLLGGNWLQVVISPDPGDDHLTATPRAAALAVAAHLVSGFNAHAH